MKYCPKCRKLRVNGNTYCPNCGEELVDRNKCPCGRKLTPKDKYCPDCGARAK